VITGADGSIMVVVVDSLLRCCDRNFLLSRCCMSLGLSSIRLNTSFFFVWGVGVVVLPPLPGVVALVGDVGMTPSFSNILGGIGGNAG